jgi:hypothetical protein
MCHRQDGITRLGGLPLKACHFNGIGQADVVIIAGSVDVLRHGPDLKQIFACRVEKLRSCRAIQPRRKMLGLKEDRHAAVNTADKFVGGGHDQSAREGPHRLISRRWRRYGGRCTLIKLPTCRSAQRRQALHMVLGKSGISIHLLPASHRVGWIEKESLAAGTAGPFFIS